MGLWYFLLLVFYLLRMSLLQRLDKLQVCTQLASNALALVERAAFVACLNCLAIDWSYFNCLKNFEVLPLLTMTDLTLLSSKTLLLRHIFSEQFFWKVSQWLLLGL